MSTTVCLAANALVYPSGGSYLWIYLNWALGLQANGCRVVWLESCPPGIAAEKLQSQVAGLRSHLAQFGLADRLTVYSRTGASLPAEVTDGCLSLESAVQADLLLDLAYGADPGVVGRFRRSLLVDIDPGQLQIWISRGEMKVAPHDFYFTIGETIGRPGSPVPDCGVEWIYTPPPVSLPDWPYQPPCSDVPYTTLTHWWGAAMAHDGELFENNKRSAFLEYQDLPGRTTAQLELAVLLAEHEARERRDWEQRGWRIRNPREVSATPAAARTYIQGSRGEFSCAKPAYVRFNTGWLSDRTVCYLASGRPAVIQYTGPTRILPEGEGVYRFRHLDEAAHALAAVERDYERQCRLARCLAEEQFDARRVVGQVLERAMA